MCSMYVVRVSVVDLHILVVLVELVIIVRTSPLVTCILPPLVFLVVGKDAVKAKCGVQERLLMVFNLISLLSNIGSDCFEGNEFFLALEVMFIAWFEGFERFILTLAAPRWVWKYNI